MCSPSSANWIYKGYFTDSTDCAAKCEEMLECRAARHSSLGYACYVTSEKAVPVESTYPPEYSWFFKPDQEVCIIKDIFEGSNSFFSALLNILE